MYDPQWLDMNYDTYYFIPWPDSQTFLEVVDGDNVVLGPGNGVFVSCYWLTDELDFEYEAGLTESL